MAAFAGLYDRTMIALEDAEARARNIKVLIFDVDGVLTDGTLTFIPKLDGTAAETKGFSAHDGLGNFPGASGRASNGHYHEAPIADGGGEGSGSEARVCIPGDKRTRVGAAKEIAAKAGVGLDELAYVGDDIVDLAGYANLRSGDCSSQRRGRRCWRWRTGSLPTRAAMGARAGCDRFHSESSGISEPGNRAVFECGRSDGGVERHRDREYVSVGQMPREWAERRVRVDESPGSILFGMHAARLTMLAFG